MADKRTMWSKRIQAWERSGQSRAAFCTARQLNLHTFDYWRRALRTVSPPALVPVVVKSSPVAAAPIDVWLPNGIRLQVPPGSDATLLRLLLDVLRAC